MKKPVVVPFFFVTRFLSSISEHHSKSQELSVMLGGTNSWMNSRTFSTFSVILLVLGCPDACRLQPKHEVGEALTNQLTN
jgi:hypothetical protein